MLKQTKTFLADLWEFDASLLVFRGALGRTPLLAVVIALNLALVYIRVLINLWNK